MNREIKVNQPVFEYEVFVPLKKGEIRLRQSESKILAFNDKYLVLDDQRFRTLYINDQSDVLYTRINQAKAYKRDWGKGLAEFNGVVGYIYSTENKKKSLSKVRKSIEKLISEEVSFCDAVIENLRTEFKKLSNH